MARKTSALESAEKTIEIEEGDEVEEGIKTTSTRRPSTRQPEKKDTTSILDEMLASFEKKGEGHFHQWIQQKNHDIIKS